MSYKLIEGKNSNYVIEFISSETDIQSAKNKSLKKFQKDMTLQGFRKGNVPLELVEKNVKGEYLQISIYEELVHATTLTIVNENKGIKFIGNIYDLDIQPEKNDDQPTGNVIFTLKLDVYPEIKEDNKDRSKEKIESYTTEPTKEEIDEAMLKLKKQYAEYPEAESVGAESLCKIKFDILDKDGTKIDSGSVFLGKEEYEEFPAVYDIVKGKKKDETITVDYNEETLPPMFANRSKEETKEPKTITGVIGEVRDMIVPEWTEENLKKLFGNDDINSEADLIKNIEEAITKEKEQSALIKVVDQYLEKVAPSFTNTIPKTIIEEEKSTRINALQERFGSKEGLDQYYKKIGEEEVKKLHSDIQGAAKISLEKFFLLRKVSELLEIEIEEKDWNTPLSVEKKLYEKLAQ